MTDSSVDYPDYAHKVARKVKINKSNQNTLFGKSLDNLEKRVA